MFINQKHSLPVLACDVWGKTVGCWCVIEAEEVWSGMAVGGVQDCSQSSLHGGTKLSPPSATGWFVSSSFLPALKVSEETAESVPIYKYKATGQFWIKLKKCIIDR